MSEQNQNGNNNDDQERPDSLDMDELAADFGGSYSIGLIRRTPELLVLAYQSQGWTNARIDPATGKIIKGKWTGKEWEPVRVAAAIQNTEWYRTTDGNIREADNARMMDPASWRTRVDRIESNMRDAAIKAGVDITGLNIRATARQMLRMNYLSMQGAGADETVTQKLIDDWLAPLIKPVSGNTYSGESEVTASNLRQRVRDYGVTFSDQWFLENIQKLRSGDITEADIDRQIIDAAKSRYGGLAATIDEKTSVKTLADPYIQMMAEVLERNPQELSLADPDIQSALQYVDPKTGQVRMKSLFEFDQELRMKPEWGNTTRGRAALNEGAMSMLKSFGMVM